MQQRQSYCRRDAMCPHVVPSGPLWSLVSPCGPVWSVVSPCGCMSCGPAVSCGPMYPHVVLCCPVWSQCVHMVLQSYDVPTGTDRRVKGCAQLGLHTHAHHQHTDTRHADAQQRCSVQYVVEGPSQLCHFWFRVEALQQQAAHDLVTCWCLCSCG
jgi:hypothetical protein